MNNHYNILLKAIRKVNPLFIAYTQNSDLTERSFCYDLYYHWRCLIKKCGEKDMILNGEPIKYNREHKSWHSPDIVLYQLPKDSNERNIIVCEIKRIDNTNKHNVKKDLCNLYKMKKGDLLFRHMYEEAVYILIGTVTPRFVGYLHDFIGTKKRSKYLDIKVINVLLNESKKICIKQTSIREIIAKNNN